MKKVMKKLGRIKKSSNVNTHGSVISTANSFKFRNLALYGCAFAIIGLVTLWQAKAATGGCSTTGVIGTATYTVSAPEATQYKLWVRMQVPDTTNTGNVNGVSVEIATNQCFTVTTTDSTAVNQWKWINYDATAATTAHITTQLSAGSQTLKILGLKSGVKVDKVLLLRSDSNCVPSNDFTNGSPGDNCTTPVATVSLSGSPAQVTTGGSSNLTWSSTDSTSCTATGGTGWAGTKSTSGSFNTGALNSTTTYAMTCTGPGGTSAQQTATITVIPPPTPTVTISANPTSVTSGGSSILTWSSTNATSCTASGGTNWIGTKATSGAQSTGTLTAVTNFVLSCTGSGGTAQNSVAVTVTAPPTSDTTAPTVVMSLPGITVASGATSVKVNNLKEVRWSPLASDTSGIKSLVLTINNQTVTLSNGEVNFGATGNGDFPLKAVATDNFDNVTTTNLLVRLRHPDINRSGVVDIFDMNSMLNRWGTVNVAYDLDTNGFVDIFDLNYLLNRWNSTQ